MQTQNKDFVLLLRYAALSVLLGAIVCGGLLCLSAALFAQKSFSQSTAVWFAGASVSAGCFAGGQVFARLKKSQGLFCGFLVGLAAVLLLSAINFDGTDLLTPFFLLRALIFLAFGCAGGIFGILKGEQKRKTRR